MSEIVQYVIIRGDLVNTLNWSMGSIIAQACHACTAVTHLFHDDIYTQTYLSDMDNMHKVILEAASEESLINLNTVLGEYNISHKLWIEQPENIPTCLVIKPYPKKEVSKYLKNFKLYR